MSRMKKSKGPPEKGMDRLSDLPDCLIHHILSFVDAKIAVQTCVLSKRWLRLWTCLPILNFDSKSFRTHAIFNKFVRRVLSGRRQCEPSNLLGLKFHSSSTDKSVLDRVIRYAVSHSVQYINMKHRRCLKDRILSCVTLRSLHLERCEISKDSFSRFINLETLTLERCYILKEERIKISAPRLVKLSISELNDGVWVPNKQEVVVSCPRLSSFCYEGKCPEILSGDTGPFLTLVLSMDGCPVLDRVDIRISRSREETLSCCLWMKTLLHEMILHAKSLVVWKNGLMVKTTLSNDDVRAMVYSEATTVRGEDVWCRGTEQDFDQFVMSMVGWFEHQLRIEARNIQLLNEIKELRAEVVEIEALIVQDDKTWQLLVHELSAIGINLPPMPNMPPPTSAPVVMGQSKLHSRGVNLVQEASPAISNSNPGLAATQAEFFQLQKEVKELKAKIAEKEQISRWLIRQLRASVVKSPSMPNTPPLPSAPIVMGESMSPWSRISSRTSSISPQKK